MSCFNCGTVEDVHRYSFDLDLPAVVACSVCVFALGQGDDELLAALRPRKTKRKAAKA